MLIEREEEIGLLRGQLEGCEKGHGAGVVVSGAIASGKTEILHAVGDLASQSGFAFLYIDTRAVHVGPCAALRELVCVARSAFGDEGNDFRRLGERLDEAPASRIRAEVGYGLMAELVRLSEQQPLVIAVDGVEHLDTPSLECFLQLAQRIRSARVFLVLGVRHSARLLHADLYAELFRQRHFEHLRLSLLTERGVAEMVADRLGGDVAERLAPAFHRISGGSPLLVRSLIGDTRASTVGRAGRRITEPVAGDSFRRAVWACVKRGGPYMLDVAHGVAVLGAATSPKLVWRLLETSKSGHMHAMQELGDAGLLASGRFRHEAAVAAVIEGMNPADTADLHFRAARLLHNEGESAVVVADHVVAGGRGGEPWSLHALHSAAEQALSSSRWQSAVEYLEPALRGSADPASRAKMLSLLARAEWQTSPAKAARRLPALQRALRDGLLRGREVSDLARYLLRQGRTEEAVEVLERLSDRRDPQAATEAAGITTWLQTSHPQVHRAVRGRLERAADSAPGARRPAPAAVLLSVLRGTADPDSIAHAEQVLQSCRIGETSLEAVEAAAFAMIHAGRLPSVTHWCDLLNEEAAERSAPTWQAMLTWIRAEVALRQGDVTAAETYARSALKRISAESWGVAVYGPLATLLLAAVAGKGDTESVEELVRSLPPVNLNHRYGLYYLRARGHFYLATDRPPAALESFLTCGEMAGGWNLDLPSLVPWRVDAAQAMLVLGKPKEARRFAEEQVVRARGADARTRGTALRVLAECADLRQRPVYLRESMELLQASGDRLELARTLRDLSLSYQALGDSSRARMIGARASRLADECGLRTEGESVAGATLTDGGSRDPGVSGLTNAELRVARLAAVGYTNREIGDKLFITMSTVEQHLTRIYRKLKVARRADLASVALSVDEYSESAC